MRIARAVAAAFFLFWLAAAVLFAVLGVLWTQSTLVRLYVPEVRGLGQYSDGVRLDILAQDGTVLYHQDYYFGGRLRPEDNISMAGYFLELARAGAKTQTEAPWWEKIFLRLEKIDTETLEGFVAEYYTKSLLDSSRLTGAKKEVLRLYTLRRLRGVYSKDELYALFFDSVHYSPKIRGITGAAKAWFNKEFHELTPLETAYLAALVTSAAKGSESEAALYYDKMARHFLYELYLSGGLSLEDYRAQMASRIRFREPEAPVKDNAVVSHVLSALHKAGLKTGESTLIVHTHYNPEATAVAMRALTKGYRADPLLQGAFVMVNAESGGVEVAVGSRVPGSRRNRALSMRRQMGSTFKPIVYATALEQKTLPCEIVEDKPYTFFTGAAAYRPHNYEDYFMGKIPLRYGLIYSLNNATVRLAERIGLKKVQKTALDMGFEGNILPYHAMALGAFPTTPLNVAQIFTTLANDGLYEEVSFISKVTDEEGNTLWEPEKSAGRRAFDSITAYQLMYMMQDVASRGTARGTGLLKGTSAKTGTTDKSKDVWTVAIYYPYVFVVWLGYDDFSPIPGDPTGGGIAAPVIAAFQEEYFKHGVPPSVKVPEDIVFAPVNARTGRLSPKGGKGTYVEAFRKGYLPPETPEKPKTAGRGKK